MPAGLIQSDSDNKILAVALRLALEGRNVIVISRDLNMRVKCDSYGIKCLDYEPQKVIKSVDSLFDGAAEICVPDEKIEDFYNNVDVAINPEKKVLYPNQFLVLKSEEDPKKTALARYTNELTPLKRVFTYNDIWGLSAKNKEQKLIWV